MHIKYFNAPTVNLRMESVCFLMDAHPMNWISKGTILKKIARQFGSLRKLASLYCTQSTAACFIPTHNDVLYAYHFPVFTLPSLRAPCLSKIDKYSNLSYYINLCYPKQYVTEPPPLYVDTENDYIWLDNTWYVVSNPSSPPIEIPTETEMMQDNIWMISIDGKLYSNTGKESTLEGRCGVMDGEIIATVDPLEIPIEDNHSNFGAGFGYQYGDNDTIEVLIHEKWMVFEPSSLPS